VALARNYPSNGWSDWPNVTGTTSLSPFAIICDTSLVRFCQGTALGDDGRESLPVQQYHDNPACAPLGHAFVRRSIAGKPGHLPKTERNEGND